MRSKLFDFFFSDKTHLKPIRTFAIKCGTCVDSRKENHVERMLALAAVDDVRSASCQLG